MVSCVAFGFMDDMYIDWSDFLNKGRISPFVSNRQHCLFPSLSKRIWSAIVWISQCVYIWYTILLVSQFPESVIERGSLI